MKLIAPLAFLVVTLVAAFYWDSSPRKTDLVLLNRGDVFTLDPQRMSFMPDFRMAYALYEGLMRWNNDDFSIEPAAAAALPEISDDRLTYTFRIRPDARWSNGDPVTAHDYVYSWKRLLWPDTAADYSNVFFVIEGAEEFFQWRSQQLSGFSNRVAARTPDERMSEAVALHEHANQRFHQTVGIRALDDETLQLQLRQPTAYFLDLLCFAPCSPVHRPTVEGWPKQRAHSPAMRERGWIGVEEPPWPARRWSTLDPTTGRIEQKHEWARAGELVSNGPYVLTEWRYKRDMRLEKNPLYHSPHIMRNTSVLLMSMEDANTAVLAFESGDIDWLAEASVEYASDMLEERAAYEHRFQSHINEHLASGKRLDDALASLPPPKLGERRNIHAYPTFGTDFYSFNCRPALSDGRANPFAHPAVRRAFAMSIDKSLIVASATRLREPVMNTFIPPHSIPHYVSPQGLEYNIENARVELAAAGWQDRNHDGYIENEHGELFPVVDLLWTSNSPRYKWISLSLKSQWQQNLGVQVELRSADTKFYKEDLKQGKFMIARGRWYGDYGDPTTFLNINRTNDGNNDRAFSSAHFDSLLDKASVERDAGKRMEILAEAERYLMQDQLPLVPICQLVQLYMYEPGKFEGLSNHPRLIQYLWELERVQQ